MKATQTREALEEKVKELERRLAERQQVDALLRKRTKEIRCLYTVLEIVNRAGIALGERLEQIAASIPQGWQYSEIASARVVFEGQAFKSNPFEAGPFSQTADIVVGGNKVGMIQVYYGEERPESDEGPFLTEERELINAIARRINTFIERRRADEARQTAQKRLQETLAKVLSGFLPICAECKRIRTHNSNWVQIETYIRNRTDVEFSHSICPECVKRLYPGFVSPT